jgi:hypothetical protein
MFKELRCLRLEERISGKRKRSIQRRAQKSNYEEAEIFNGKNKKALV